MEPVKQKPHLKSDFFGVCRMLNRAPSTAEAYWGWCFQFLKYFVSVDGTWTHPKELGPRDSERITRSRQS